MLNLILPHVLNFITTLVCGALIAYVRKLRNKYTAIGAGIEALLRDRILQTCNYWLTKGYCPANERKSIEKMFMAYSDLGGNDVAHDAYLSLRKLPMTKPRWDKLSQP